VILIHKKVLILSLYISLLCLLLLVKNCLAYTAFVEIEFSKSDTARVVDFSITKRNFDYFFTGKGFGNYSIKILDEEGKTLYSEIFGGLDFVLQKYTETGYITEEIDYINKSFRLFLPDNSYFIKFYKEDKEMVSISLPNYVCNNNLKCESDKGESGYLCPRDCPSGTTTTTKITTTTIQLCNKNKKCEPSLGENYKTCPQDCPSGSRDGFCDGIADGICDPDCTEKEDPNCKKPSMLWVYIVVGMIIIVLFALFFMKIGGKKEIERPRQYPY
jgi:hypothetical protein